MIGADVIVNRDVGPVLAQDSLAEGLPLNELHGLKAAEPAGGEAESADAREGVEHPQRRGHDARGAA